MTPIGAKFFTRAPERVMLRLKGSRVADSAGIVLAVGITVLQALTVAAPQAASTAAAPMLEERWTHTATLLSNGKVLVAGGAAFVKDSWLDSAELYDPIANVWTSVRRLALGRSVHAATSLASGKVLVLGGMTGGNQRSASAEVYDAATNSWSGAPPLSAPRYTHTATLLKDGRVLVVGGSDAADQALASAEVLNPATGVWQPAGQLATARQRHTATLLGNGKVLVTGGDDSGLNVLATSELFDPATNTWSGAASLSVARQRHAATALPDGRVLVLGGIDRGGLPTVAGVVLASVEVYDPSTNTWTGAPPLAAARQRPTATLLPNGLVLIAGGRDAGGSIVATTELYSIDGSAPVVPVDVVEFYHAGFDHYFITWVPSEIAMLDQGINLKGWARTSRTFRAYASVLTGTSPICRFYIPPALGDSHFFGRGQLECDATARNFPTLTLEDPRFMYLFLPVAGNCPADTTPVYRVFSNRADANHRYTTDANLRDQMVTSGWLAEGDGSDRVVMCAPR